MDQNEIVNILSELHKRSMGYAFGGPDNEWCEPSIENKGIELPKIPENSEGQSIIFKGCLKYSNCRLIPEKIRWKAWDDLTNEEKMKLEEISCYRATRLVWDKHSGRFKYSELSSWDIGAIKSRQNSKDDGKWIANPFGIRANEIGEIVENANLSGQKLNLHRDISPCPMGGCITPEMERDYYFENRINDKSKWKHNKACPYYFRHTNEEMTDVQPNLQRFAQCYVTQNELKDILDKAGLIVAAPIFKARSEGLSDSYWYSFFSGFSFIQLLANKFQVDNPNLVPFEMRWMATSITRQHVNNTLTAPHINRLLKSTETGELISTWEKEERLISISDGFATALLLQWVIGQRLQAAMIKNTNQINIFDLLEWVYEENEPNNTLINKLVELGFDIKNSLLLKIGVDGKVYRTSTLIDDLYLLGLIDSNGEVTIQLQTCILWLKTRIKNTNYEADFGKEISEWLSPSQLTISELPSESNLFSVVLKLCSVFVNCCLPECINQIPSIDNFKGLYISDIKYSTNSVNNFINNSAFKKICILMPKVHLIVRAFVASPIRWLFIPMNYSSGNINVDLLRPNLNSGIIILVKDNINSRAYNSYLELKDEVLEKVRQILPILIMVANIEEENIREEFIRVKELFDYYQKDSMTIGHSINLMMFLLKKHETPGNKFINHLLKNINRRFMLLPYSDITLQKSKKFNINLEGIIKEAINFIREFCDYIEDLKNVQIEFLGNPKKFNTDIFVTPIVGYYSDADALETAKDDILNLIEDLILQRITQNEKEIIISIHEYSDTDKSLLYIRIETDALPPQFEWEYPRESLYVWPIGRGFFTTFWKAKNLGALKMQIFNYTNELRCKRGIIQIAFERILI